MKRFTIQNKFINTKQKLDTMSEGVSE